MTLILSKSSDHALDDLQLADEHDSLMVSSDIQATSEEDVLTEQLENLYWHEETIGANVKVLILVTIYGCILMISWVFISGIWEIYKLMEVFKKYCPQLNYYSIIHLAPKATFGFIYFFIELIFHSSHLILLSALMVALGAIYLNVCKEYPSLLSTSTTNVEIDFLRTKHGICSTTCTVNTLKFMIMTFSYLCTHCGIYIELNFHHKNLIIYFPCTTRLGKGRVIAKVVSDIV